MELDPDEADLATLYRTLSGAVVPRPIGWISTAGEDGDNLAPYSFFNVVCVSPPMVMFAPVDGEEGLKDTPRNVLETGEFVVNVVTADLAEAMNRTSATLPTGESEFDHAGLERAASQRVSPPRVAAAAVAFECELFEFLDVGGSSVVLGDVVYVHLSEAVTTDGRMDTAKLDAIGRLAGSGYAHTRDRFSMERPP